MKKEIYKTALDLILVLTFIIVSIPIWDAYAARMPDVIETPSKLALNYEELTAEAIFTVNGTKENIKEAELFISNYSNKTKTGQLIFKYAKSSTLDYHHLNVILNGEMNNLANFLMTSDDSYYIFIVKDLELTKYEQRKYTFGLWLDEKAGAKVISTEFAYLVEVI